MKKIILTLVMALAATAVWALEPSQIRKEFKGHLPALQKMLPRQATSGLTWESIEHVPKGNLIVLTYKVADAKGPLDTATAAGFYETNRANLSEAYAKASDPLVRYAVDGDMILRFVYLTPEGASVATLDYPPSALKADTPAAP